MLGQVELITQHAVLACCPVLLGSASLCPDGIVVVMVVLLVCPIHYILILKRFITRAQVAKAFVDM